MIFINNLKILLVSHLQSSLQTRISIVSPNCLTTTRLDFKNPLEICLSCSYYPSFKIPIIFAVAILKSNMLVSKYASAMFFSNIH